MAGTATDYDTTKISYGKKTLLWCELAVPAAGARITLHTDGTPESVANPNAVHMGHTEDGLRLAGRGNTTDWFVDELLEPAGAFVESSDAMISGNLRQVLDHDIMALLTPGIGTKGAASGYTELTLGAKDVVYSPTAAIWLTNTAAKFAVFNLYKAKNQVGFEFSSGRKQVSSTPIEFRGFGISSRAEADSLGNYWTQVS